MDHFVPWARYPDNSLTNLVLAHSTCNSSKRDHLASAVHVEKWAKRASDSVNDLAGMAHDLSWEHRPSRTFSVARSIYLRLPDDARLWQGVGQFAEVNREVLAAAFAMQRPGA